MIKIAGCGNPKQNIGGKWLQSQYEPFSSKEGLDYAHAIIARDTAEKALRNTLGMHRHPIETVKSEAKRLAQEGHASYGKLLQQYMEADQKVEQARTITRQQEGFQN